MLERLASACFRHRWRVIALWLVALVGLFAAKGAFGGSFADGGRLPGTDSQKAYDLARAEMPNLTDDSATVVFHDAAGLDRPATAAAVRSYLDQVRALPGISAVTSPFDAPEQRSADGTVAFATVELAADHPAETTAAAMAEKAKALQHPGLDVALGGYLFQDVQVPASEGVGLLAAAIILLIAFGSVVAMGLPILTAMPGVMASIGGARRCGPPPCRRPTSPTQVAIDDRHRRGHRLRPVHRHPVPHGAAAGPGAARRHRRGHGHRRAGRGVRRLHRDDLPARAAAHAA